MEDSSEGLLTHEQVNTPGKSGQNSNACKTSRPHNHAKYLTCKTQGTSLCMNTQASQPSHRCVPKEGRRCTCGLHNLQCISSTTIPDLLMRSGLEVAPTSPTVSFAKASRQQLQCRCSEANSNALVMAACSVTHLPEELLAMHTTA